MNRALAVVLGAVLAAAVPVRADVILTTSGGRITGKIIEEKDSEIKVKTEKGTVVTIPRDEIDTITREKPEDTYARRVKALKSDDVKGLLELATWARDNKLPTQSADACERVIKADADNFDARSALGYEKVSGKWLKGEDLMKAKGLVKYQGRWITPEEKGLLEQGFVKRGDRWVSKEEAQCLDEGRPYHPGGDAAPAPRADPVEKPVKQGPQKPEASPDEPPKPAAEPKPAPIDLPADDKELMEIVLAPSRKVEERDAAVKALAAKGDSQKQALGQELAKLADAGKKAVLDHVKAEKGNIRTKMAALVVDRRKAALTLIFDKTQYPDEDHGKVGQPTVDKLVDELRRAWQDPLHELLRDKSEKKLQERMDELQRVALWMRDLGGVFDMRKAEDELAQEANKLVGISEAGVDGQELEASKATLKWNATTKTTLTTEERECILATNEYRMMFGLPALKAHERLIQAARKHSQEMVDMKYFAHDSPVPENSSPSKRCSKEGAKYTGENIAMGSPSGRTTFVQWYHSSGHHRNMLMRHRSMGVGNVGQTWTEDFGIDDPQ